MKFFHWRKVKDKIVKDLQIHKRKKNIPKLILFILGYTALTLCLVAVISFAWFSKDLPTPSKIAGRKPTISTKIYDRTGEILLYETGEQKRTIITSDQIPTFLKDATVSTEDANFYKHHGLDFKAILSAIVEKVTGRRQVARGGSTITQQYVKNALLTSDRSLTRKAKEAILSVELELMFKKDEILTMYLNEIPYGNATAGAEAAARVYYGKQAKDLTLAEAATLAAIPKAPTFYSPYGTHVDKLIIRKEYVLDQMVKNGRITLAQSEEAKKEDTTTLGIALKPRRDSMLAPHFAMYVMEQIANEFGEEKIQKEGLKIITTLDYDKQKIAEQAVTDGAAKLAKYGGTNAALVAVDPKNGQILSMVGSMDYFNVAIDGNVNVADSARQPGSSFKPFAYATAFKKPGYSPSKIIFDLETDFGNYVPHNYNNRSNGPVTMRTALSNSLNVPAVKVMALAGIDNTLKTASDMGITTLTQRDRYGLSLVLGSGEVKPVEMAGAFSVFATGGIKNPITPILKISDASSKTIYDFEKDKKPAKQVLDSQVAYEISNILSDNKSRSLVFGTNSQLNFPDRVVAAKTGTTNDFKDAWTVGFTPSISVAVWTGNSDATKMKAGADGSIVAAPIFHNFIDKAMANVPNEEFTRPKGITEVTVEKYSNKLPSAYSTQTTTDIFAEWQVPKDKDDLHKVYRVCKGTNKLAPEGMDPALIEDKVLTDLHSEMPNYPNWEGPVRAWAIANNMTADVPTETCDAASFVPTVSVVSPASGATVSGEINILASANSAYGVKEVEFFIDDVLVGTSSSSPYNINYDLVNANISAGSHKISAVITDSNGSTSRDEIPVVVQTTKPVITISSSKVSSNPDLSFDISWTTDRPTTWELIYSSSVIPALTIESPVATATTHKTTIINLLHGLKYTFTIHVTDANQNTAEYTGSFDTPLSSVPDKKIKL